MIKMMTASQPPRDVAHQHSVTIRALSSITPQQANIIVQAVRASGLDWVAQTTDDYDGYLSILVEPAAPDDNQKSYFISGTTQKFELFETQDDNLVALASCSDVTEISTILFNLIAQRK
jgi:hypothetical protein